MKNNIYTIGHSTRSVEEFVAILEAYKIEIVADVRTIPRSRHNPQFNSDELNYHLKLNGIEYRHIPGLGGLRHTSKDSVNMAWKNLTFRGYADYMQTPEFRSNLEELIKIASEKQTVIMCAEAVPWRCHRSLIGDALLVRGIPVVDIISGTSSKPHTLIPWAKVDGNRITYPDLMTN